MDIGKKIGLFGFIVLIIVGLFIGCQALTTVDYGTYHVKQAIVSGEMSAIMQPGLYGKWFGNVTVWPKAGTFHFTKDNEEGEKKDQSITVRFGDGSTAQISGTIRIVMPTDSKQAIALVTEQGYKSFEDLEQNLMLKVVRNALMLTANTMTARESYAERRNDYVFWSQDQIQNGIYETEEAAKQVVDSATGEKATKTFKVIKRDKNGVPIYQKSPLHGTGITVANFEIKDIVYSKEVEEQIQTQQKATMSIVTAKAEALKAEQDKLKIEAEGKAKVATAQYEQEQDKVKEVVQAQKRLDVAKLDKESAALKKAKDILEGEGEAAKRKLIMTADGALEKKIAAWVEVNKVYATEFAKVKWSPEIQMGSSTSASSNAQAMIDLLTTKTARDLGLDLKINKD
jgi:regulator of protease activity HflC (stomatin/prohibitin superfamily)